MCGFFRVDKIDFFIVEIKGSLYRLLIKFDYRFLFILKLVKFLEMGMKKSFFFFFVE